MAESASNRRSRARKERAPSDPPSERAPNPDQPDVGDELPVLLFVQERLRQVLADNESLTDKLESLRDRIATTDELSMRVRDLEMELRGARADSNRLRAIAEKESIKRKKAEELLGEHEAPSRLPFGTRSISGLQHKLEVARKEVSKRQEELSREIEARRALETELKALRAQSAQSDALLRRRIEESERNQAALEQQIESVQEDLEARGERAEARELEVERRLEAVRSREAELVSRQKELDLRERELQASVAQLQRDKEDVERRESLLRRADEEAAPKVIRLDEEEGNEASVKEMLAMLVDERRERRITEAELLRVRERASLLEHELSRLKGGAEKGRRRR